ncbi:MAG: 16S rRNA (adenine(1518)-N(6)/adenine(1519)-N(6))-dimethyltransferase RsmA [Candidatus Nitrosotenuis sp.]
MKRQRLGQHFLLSQNIAKKIVDSAQITKKNTVLEVGTGRGILTTHLCQKAKSVVSVEKDEVLYSEAILRLSQIPNLELMYGDGFSADTEFTIFVSNLPYSESKRAIEWLAQQRFLRAVIMVQAEFAEKILSMGKKEMRAISVIANHAFEIEKIMSVGKNNFEPPPKVDSVVLRLKKKRTIPAKTIESVNKLFSYRRKTIGNILKKFGKTIQSDKRLEELDGDEIIRLAKQIS